MKTKTMKWIVPMFLVVQPAFADPVEMTFLESIAAGTYLANPHSFRASVAPYYMTDLPSFQIERVGASEVRVVTPSGTSYPIRENQCSEYVCRSEAIASASGVHRAVLSFGPARPGGAAEIYMSEITPRHSLFDSAVEDLPVAWWVLRHYVHQ